MNLHVSSHARVLGKITTTLIALKRLKFGVGIFMSGKRNRRRTNLPAETAFVVFLMGRHVRLERLSVGKLLLATLAGEDCRLYFWVFILNVLHQRFVVDE